MGLSSLLARVATSRCHVLLVEVPGAASVRMEVQRELVRLGWVEADSPSEADILCVCGAPSGELLGAVDRVWEQLPGPRARTTVVTAEQVARELHGCAERLREPAAQTADAAGRDQRPAEPDDQMDDSDDMNHGGMDHGDMDHGDGNHGGMDHGDMDHGDGDDGMDHGGMDMDMPMPGGIGLAGQEEDRDGLDLDVLHLPLGPVLPSWPAGLVLRCTIQGDVIFSATAELLEGTPAPDPLAADARAFIVHRTDLAGRVLRLAGSDAAAERMYRIRNAALAGEPLGDCRGPLMAELAALKRSVLLRRSLRGVGTIGADSFHAEAGTDAWARLTGWVEGAVRAANGETDAAGVPASWPVQAALLEQLVAGEELSRVRLLVASLDLAPVGTPEVLSR
ncbi:hypothetical protein KIH31_14975 [Paenarthrobacter sp. DKR-5]|uniref:hypothetical protein n=1 Tax=Paenarthrobacter sp. DKR-5 TaxID=2835535 RepID=UPI001BDD3ABC|nr:hypothetical protein [Paenarthrobacter sp. DKR-5]MBT1003897.1 hypothetical protein [Paenarthrobacter sp. DKR-5]